MQNRRLVLPISIILVFALLLVAASLQVFPSPVLANNGNNHIVKTFTGPDGKQVDVVIFPEKPPAEKMQAVRVPPPNSQPGTKTLSNVPAFYWSYGCSATSAAMLFGYYDRTGYSNMYTGSTNLGFCPLNNSVWGTTVWPSITCGECPLSATHTWIDGRAADNRGHVDDYWIDYGSGSDPYIIGNRTAHTSDCAGDFMGTNQSIYGNTDGSTTFYFYTNGTPYDKAMPGDGAYGMKLFAQNQGYTVVAAFSQYIKGYRGLKTGFSFNDYTAEIDANRPVIIQVNGHSMLGFGYNKAKNIVYVHDTWDYQDHSMTWGKSYAGMQQYGVTVLRLAPAN
jgi:hypothetical protein